MANLQHITDGDDLRELMSRYEEDPLFYHVWHSIKFDLESTFPNTKLSLYSCRIGNGVLLLGYKQNKITRDFVVLYQHGDFENDRLDDAFEEFCNFHPFPESVMYIGEERLTKAVSAFFKKRLPSAVIESYPTTLFYMTQKQAHSLQYLDAPGLPAGYSIGSADPEADAELITKTWIHSKENEVEQTRAKLTCFPTSCVRLNGNPVGFEMIEHIGCLNHLFVLEPHRRKGLANAIEFDLARKIVRRGFKVYKTVELYNTAVLSASARSPLWTAATDLHGNHVNFVFLVVSRK